MLQNEIHMVKDMPTILSGNNNNNNQKIIFIKVLCLVASLTYVTVNDEDTLTNHCGPTLELVPSFYVPLRSHHVTTSGNHVGKARHEGHKYLLRV